MRSSYRLCRLFGIDIRVHNTFVILPLIYGLSDFYYYGLRAAVQAVVFICLVFCFVVLHELGHSLMAKWYGVGVRDITLLPIGGMARMERIPRDPWAELAISLAGPAVNVLALMVLLPVLIIWTSGEIILSTHVAGWNLLAYLLMVNFALLLFNVLPIFPMDGGRVLRAILAMWMPYVRATVTAANIGKIAAILVGVGSFLFLGSWFIPLIMLFLYRMGQAEKRMVLAQAHQNEQLWRHKPPGGYGGGADYTYHGAEFYEPDSDRRRDE